MLGAVVAGVEQHTGIALGPSAAGSLKPFPRMEGNSLQRRGSGPTEAAVPPAELVVPELFGAVLEALLDEATRRRSGAHHTSPAIAAGLVDVVLDDWQDRCGAGGRLPAAVCDPAVGGGVFLLAAARALVARGTPPSGVAGSLFGADLDPSAAVATRAALALWAGQAGAGAGGDDAGARVVEGDGLHLDPTSWPGGPAGGFDLVVGNPPFLNQLGRGTARTRDEAQRLRARFGDAAAGYADAAGLFLVAACRLARPGGGVAMIQPESLLGARDAAGVREAVSAAGSLRALWLAGERVFPAGVRVCAPVVAVGPPSVGAPSRVRTLSGPGFEDVGPARLPLDAPGAARSWASVAAAARGTPEVDLAGGTGTVGDLATATAGFRDQFYGLVPHVVEAGAGGRGDAVRPLVTAGAIDPLHCRWGERPVRFAGRRWEAPVVDLTSLSADPALSRWVANRLAPKLLVAGQTRVVEVVVDAAGALVPSVPVIALAAETDRLWALAAVLLAPPVTAWALHRAGGTALAADAVKLSSRQVMEVPLPVDRARWEAVASTLAAGSEGPPAAFGAAMVEAYGLPAGHPVLAWWLARLVTWRGMPVPRLAPG